MKFTYIYQIKTNNLCYGSMLLGSFKTYKEALNKISYFQNEYGVCDIYKKRVQVNKERS